MKYKTSQEDFEVFKSAVNDWIHFFGLLSWGVCVEHNNLFKENGGTLCADLISRNATICLTINWPYKPDVFEIRRVAFHEVCELLLFELTLYAEQRCPVGNLEELTHRVIKSLENSVFTALDTDFVADKLHESSHIEVAPIEP